MYRVTQLEDPLQCSLQEHQLQGNTFASLMFEHKNRHARNASTIWWDVDQFLPADIFWCNGPNGQNVVNDGLLNVIKPHLV
jgi:hypothetical protein